MVKRIYFGCISEHNDDTSIIDITDSASKLKAYTDLFDDKGMKTFN